jgi:pimeloyl-ACP methyl ester carboxylesterase
METVEVHGLRLACRRTGNGPTVMFVHGGVADGRSWTPQLEALSDEFTTIAWDEPGAGGSDFGAGTRYEDILDNANVK